MNFNYLNINDSILCVNYYGADVKFFVGKVVRVTKTQVKVETNIIRNLKPLVYTFKRNDGSQILDAFNYYHLQPMDVLPAINKRLEDLKSRREADRLQREVGNREAEQQRREEVRELKALIGQDASRWLLRHTQLNGSSTYVVELNPRQKPKATRTVIVAVNEDKETGMHSCAMTYTDHSSSSFCSCTPVRTNNAVDGVWECLRAAWVCW